MLYNLFDQEVAPELRFWSANRNLMGSTSWFPLYAIFAKLQLVIGVDSDLVSLILAKKYLEEHGVTNVLLVCAYAQKLPIASDAVSYAIAQNVLEHLFNVETALRELRRVLHDGGCFCGDSRNRYDLLFPEPHVKLR